MNCNEYSTSVPAMGAPNSMVRKTSDALVWQYRIGFRLRSQAGFGCTVKDHTDALILLNDAHIRLSKECGLSVNTFMGIDRIVRAAYPITAGETRREITNILTASDPVGDRREIGSKWKSASGFVFYVDSVDEDYPDYVWIRRENDPKSPDRRYLVHFTALETPCNPPVIGLKTMTPADQPLTNEDACTVLEHASKHILEATNADNGNDQFDAAHILIEAHKAVGPWGQIPSWEQAVQS
jgi:hypothetical protein